MIRPIILSLFNPSMEVLKRRKNNSEKQSRFGNFFNYRVVRKEHDRVSFQRFFPTNYSNKSFKYTLNAFDEFRNKQKSI